MGVLVALVVCCVLFVVLIVPWDVWNEQYIRLYELNRESTLSKAKQ